MNIETHRNRPGDATSAPGPARLGVAPPVLVATLLLSAAAAYEFSRIALSRPWPIGAPISHTFSGLLAALWITASISIPLRRRSRGMAVTAWVSGVAAPAAMVFHALFLQAVQARIALAYLPLAAAVGFCVAHVFNSREIRRLRRAMGLADP